MADTSYHVTFSGEIVPGGDLSQVKENLTALFKTDAARIERMFAGGRVAIKQGLDHATALKYQTALKEAGALVEILAAGGASAGATGAAEVLSPNVVASHREDGLSMAEPGVRLVEPEAVQPLMVDLEGLDLAEPGVVLVEHPEVPPLRIDLSGMTMAEPGARLVDPEVVAPAQIDISELSLA